MIYVALLRGINVGGNNKVDMKKLTTAFEQAGMQDVKTYINSGNIIFTNKDLPKEKITKILEEAITENFSLTIKVLVKNYDEISTIMKKLPTNWVNDSKTSKSDVMFLWEDYDTPDVLNDLTIKPNIDTVLYVSGAILWNVDRKHLTKSGMQKLIGTKLYKHMTIRNVNTTRKIYELMGAIA